MTYVQLTQKERESLGITDNFLRISIGLEGAQNLIDDINQALNKGVK